MWCIRTSSTAVQVACMQHVAYALHMHTLHVHSGLRVCRHSAAGLHTCTCGPLTLLTLHNVRFVWNAQGCIPSRLDFLEWQRRGAD